MSAIWLIKLFFAHLLTDFVAQPKKWVEAKAKLHFRAVSLYLHTAITAMVALLLIGLRYWPYAIAIFVTHTAIDIWKSYRPEKLRYFILDQLLHVLVIIGCWYFAFYSFTDIEQLLQHAWSNQHFWILLTAFLFLSFPSGIIIGKMTKKWSDGLGAGLANAGQWIGVAERMLILIFLLQNQFEAIGFLIAAKGLLRFNEMQRTEEKTEYVLIGTLLSVSFAVITGVIVKSLL
jgi:hypothetical protein